MGPHDPEKKPDNDTSTLKGIRYDYYEDSIIRIVSDVWIFLCFFFKKKSIFPEEDSRLTVTVTVTQRPKDVEK